MKTGTIKAIISERRFGFITADGQDVFFHRSDLENRGHPMFDQLNVGDVVEFELVDPRPPKGARARNVRYPKPEEVSING